MNWETKKQLSYFTLAFYFFVYGVEYAVVFPTIWGFLRSVGTTHEYILGLAIAAYSFSGLLVAPIAGRWFDRSHNARCVLLTANIFEIVGSLMYSFGLTSWFIILSRLVCGIGAASSSAVMADIACSTTVEERTSILTKLQACRQFGLLFGPAFNLLLRKSDFYLGSYHINKFTCPGIFMAVVWVLVQLACILFYYNLSELQFMKLNEEKQLITEAYKGSSGTQYGSIDSAPKLNGRYSSPKSNINGKEVMPKAAVHDDLTFSGSYENTASGEPDASNNTYSRFADFTRSNEMIESAERVIRSYSERSANNSSAVAIPTPQSSYLDHEIPAEDTDLLLKAEDSLPYMEIFHGLSFSQRVKFYADEFLRDEVIALVNAAFMSIFIQACLETIVTPMMKTYYDYGDFENSLLYLFGGLEILIVFVGVGYLSNRVSDRHILLGGSIIMLFALTWMVTWIPRFLPGDISSLPYFIVGIFADLLGIPPLLSCSISLYSKVIRPEIQGLAQGLRQSCIYIGLILGPIWGGALTNKEYILFGVLLALMIISTLMVMFSYSKLNVTSQHGENKKVKIRPINQPNENTPLIT